MVYQPRIDREHVRHLYELKEATGTPMTVLVNKILAEFFATVDASTLPRDDEHRPACPESP
jgi:hypothetical protein